MTTETDTPDFGEHTEAVLAWHAAQTAGLKNKNSELLTTVKTLQPKAKVADEIDLDEYQALRAEKAASLEKKEKDKGNFDAILQKRSEQHALELKAERDKLDKLTGRLTKTTFERQTIEALGAEGGVPKLLLPVIERRTRTALNDEGDVVIEILDEDGIPVADGTIKSLVAALKADPEYGTAFRSTAASGGGASTAATRPTDGVDNPWLPATRNMTKQGQIERDNPALAAKLKAAAGK
jgi:hypothetical protein